MQGNAMETTNMDPEELQSAVKSYREGKLEEAESKLEDFLKTNPESAIALKAYAFLIRFSAERRELGKITSYMEAIKRIPISGTEEKRMYAECLYQTGTVWHYSTNGSKARDYFTEALKISETLQDNSLIFKTRLGLATVLRSEGKYTEVLDQADELEALSIKSNDHENKGFLKMLIGNVHRKQGNYRRAVEIFEQAKEMLSVNKNSAGYHYVLWAIGTCYAALEDVDKARIYLDLATNDERGGVEFWRINILSKMTLAELYTVTGKYSQAEECYKAISKLVGGDEVSYYGRRMMRGEALLAIRKGNYEEANEKIDQLVVNAVRENNQREIMRLRPLKAEVLLRTGEVSQHEQATEMLDEALVFFKERGLKRHYAVCLELLARLESRCGYTAESLKKAKEMVAVCQGSMFERLYIKSRLIEFVLSRKAGHNVTSRDGAEILPLINKLNTEAERVILSRFLASSYDTWSGQLSKLNPHDQRYVNEFFEDFHFVPEQSTDMEVDPISHYVREKHLGEIPFHNKFTLMKILLLLAEKPGKEFSKEELAEKIWEQEYNPLRHDNNIYININRLRKLVEPNPRESRYIMNGSQGYYFNPNMKVNISTKIADTAPRLTSQKTPEVQP